MNNSHENKFLYNGSFAEIVSDPTTLTFSYFKNWFSGEHSIGKAMDLLLLPNKKVSDSILELLGNELVVNLKTEENTLYKDTIFYYSAQNTISQTPNLKVNPLKLINPRNWPQTLQIILVQSKWIAKPQDYADLAQSWVYEIPALIQKDDPELLDLILMEEVWPKVIAIGILAEFYAQYLKIQLKDNFTKISPLIDQKISQDDWFFHSISDQQKVKEGSMTFEEYKHEYGFRGDKDYELTSPRWYEMEDVLKKRIAEFSLPPNSKNEVINTNEFEQLSPRLKHIIDAFVNLQILRSEAKKRTLSYINALRILLRPEIDKNFSSQKSDFKLETQNLTTSDQKLFGKGTPVSAGAVSGACQIIQTANDIIQNNSIAIFPNASPEFAALYPKCKGMIFLRGGQTSHGAIVAREFAIPALIDNTAAAIKTGSTLNINGASGEWLVTDPSVM